MTDYLLADVFHALTGEPHPSRPKPSRSSDTKAKIAALIAQRKRLDAQKETTP